MGILAKVGGTWRNGSPYVKVNGTWKLAKRAFTKVGDVWKSWFVQGGFADAPFSEYGFTEYMKTGSGTEFGTVFTSVVQPDGKILLGGSFFSYDNDYTIERLVRINADGTRDTGFNLDYLEGYSAINSNPRAMAVQSDGKIVIGGQFTFFNDVQVNRIMRLNANGTRDTAFSTNTGTGASLTVFAVAVQSDGKILLAGQFTTFNGATVNRIVRLNTDGTRDTAFTTNTGTGASGTINSMAIQPDGKIILGGFFATFNGATVNNIVRLNSDGTRDTAFTTNTGTGTPFGNVVSAIALRSDGRIVLGGSFNTFNGSTVGRVVRLNADGTRDTSFITNTGTGANSNVNAILIDPGGSIFLGGTFSTFNGIPSSGMVRLNNNGTMNSDFTSNIGTGLVLGGVNSIVRMLDGNILFSGNIFEFRGTKVASPLRLNLDGQFSTRAYFDDYTQAIAVQSDGKIVVGGDFFRISGISHKYVTRLQSDGRPDTGFNIGTGCNNTVQDVKIQTDGKILVGGFFTTFNGSTVNYIVRLNTDGTRDTTFTTNNGTGANNLVFTVAVQPDGKILVGGLFTAFNGSTVGRIVRLNSDGTRDTTFITNTGTGASSGVYAIAVQPDGKILIGGAFTTFNGATVNCIVRLNSNGTRDTAFTTNTGTGLVGSVDDIAVQSDGKIILVGSYTTFNGVTVNKIVRLNSDGTRDTAFTTNNGAGFNYFADGGLYSVVVQPNGKIVVSGQVTIFSGARVGSIIRFNADGSRDVAFTTNGGTGTNGYVLDLALQTDGKIIAGGNLTFFNGNYVGRIVRLSGELAE
jgi:uncharacterized delta-60 repeat protein